MPIDAVDVFWSYAHEDNDRQGGRVRALADALLDEFAVVTGEELDLFLDRKSLRWGDAWRDTIEQAVGSTPFFVAIITPKYLRSAECRKELLAFSREAQSRNVTRLLLPILFIDVEGLQEDSDDEVRSLIARTQYESWTSLRLKAKDDPDVLQAINRLALSIRDRKREVSETQLVQEARSDSENSARLAEDVKEIESRIGSWLESVEFDQTAGAQWAATMQSRLERVDRLRAGRQPAGAILSIYKRLGLELLPIAVNRLEKAKNYSRLSIELDPFVTSVIRYVADLPTHSSLLDGLRDGVQEACFNIEPPEGRDPGYGTFPSSILGHSAALVEAWTLIQDSRIYVNEANDIVLQWRDNLAALDRAIEDRELSALRYADPLSPTTD